MTEQKRTKICLIFAWAVALLFTVWILKEREEILLEKERKAQETLAEEVIRFHVLANSNETVDQERKQEVKEQVLVYLKKEMQGTDKAETTDWIQLHLQDIQKVAQKVVKDGGEDMPVTVAMVKRMFPTKTYGDLTFPAGVYDALQIRIGKAEGRNWWCCLYPRLCFTNSLHPVVPEEEKGRLKQILDEDEYGMMEHPVKIKIKWFFGQ